MRPEADPMTPTGEQPQVSVDPATSNGAETAPPSPEVLEPVEISRAAEPIAVFDQDVAPVRAIDDAELDALFGESGSAPATMPPVGEEVPVGAVEGDVLVLDEPAPMPYMRPRKVGVLERRRRVKLQARRVRRIIRHVEPWSVMKMSVIFYACLWVILLVAGVIVWTVAESADVISKLESQIREYFVLDEFQLDSGEVFRGYAFAGLAFAIAGTAFNVLMCLLFNLISDLVGGVRVTMIEEETARPRPTRRGSRPVRR